MEISQQFRTASAHVPVGVDQSLRVDFEMGFRRSMILTLNASWGVQTKDNSASVIKTRVIRPPISMATELKFAKPQRAKVAMIIDLGSSSSPWMRGAIWL